MKKIAKNEFIIGLSVIVAIAILIVGIDYLKGINLFRPANYYVASYDNVAGLEISAPVTIDGFKVGQVREINFDYEKPGKIQVLLALNKKLHLPEDSYAYITSSLLGSTAVEIHLGSSSKLIAVGGDLPTKVAPDLMSSISQQVMPAINSILPKVDSLVANLNTLVASPALAQSINRLDGITGNLLTTTSGLNTTINGQLPLIMNNAGKITTNLDSITLNLGLLSYQLKQLPLSTTIDNVNTVTDNLIQFSQALNNQQSTLGKLTNDPEMYNRLNTVVADIDSLIVDIKKNPKRYISIKLL